VVTLVAERRLFEEAVPAVAAPVDDQRIGPQPHLLDEPPLVPRVGRIRSPEVLCPQVVPERPAELQVAVPSLFHLKDWRLAPGQVDRLLRNLAARLVARELARTPVRRIAPLKYDLQAVRDAILLED
jgi:hypothetical protein